MSKTLKPNLVNLFNLGFDLVKSAVSSFNLKELALAVDSVLTDKMSLNKPGQRHMLKSSKIVYDFANSPQIMELASVALGNDCQPVRALLFNKTSNSNWFVPWHQDITIAVKEHKIFPGFINYTLKDGLIHVQPPAHILEQMLAIRIHLDDSTNSNGAIKFYKGSHLSGILTQSQINDLITNQTNIVSCQALTGDIIIMKPLIVHSSPKIASTNSTRRVLHIEYALNNILPSTIEFQIA